MIELLDFIFADITHFLGCVVFLLIIVYGVINFKPFNITKNEYKLMQFDEEGEDEIESN